MAQFIMAHLLGLCLFCIYYSRQDVCSSPGNLTSPRIFLNTLSNNRDTILVKCQLSPLSNFSRVILCKGGKEVQSLEQKDSKFAYNFYYKISEDGAGNISCMFQLKDTNNQMKNSGLSNVEILDTRGSSHALSLGFGISIYAILMLAVVFYLLKKRGIIKWRSTREQHRPSTAIEMENQPKDQLTNTSIDGGFLDNAPHTYAEVTSNQFNSPRSHAEKTQGTPDLLYSSIIEVKIRDVPRFCEE